MEFYPAEIVAVDAETATEGDTQFEPRAGHVSHFATCQDAKSWRKRTREG